MQQVTTKALFRQRGRNRRVQTAFTKTNKYLVLGWQEPDDGFRRTPDNRLIDKLDLPFKRYTSEKMIAGKLVTLSQRRLAVAPKDRAATIRKVGNYVQGMLQVGTEQAADEVVETVLPDGRIVFLHSFAMRLAQRLMANVLVPRLERHGVLSDHLHSYRPGRSRLTALADVRKLIEGGHRYFAKSDIKGFFPSTSTELVGETVLELCPWIHESFSRAILWAISPSILLRRPTHLDRAYGNARADEPAPRCLLQGAVLPPVLSNLVGTYVLDRPLMEFFGPEVVIVRYSDDFALLGTDPGAVAEAISGANEVLKIKDLHLHPKKTMWEPVDITRHPARLLGKLVHGGTVQTPPEDVDRFVGELADELDPLTGAYRRRVWEILDEFTADDVKKLSLFEAKIRRVGGQSRLLAFRELRRQWERTRRHEARHAPDPEDIYQLVDHVVHQEMGTNVSGADNSKFSRFGANGASVEIGGAHAPTHGQGERR